jgi:Ca-activated chloride channel family protein
MRFLLVSLLAFASGTALAAPSLTAPATAEAGSTITMQLTGAADPRDFVTVVPKGTPEGSYKAYVYATAASLKLVMPAQAGDYELRLCAAASPYKTLLSKPIQITAA